MADIKLLVAIWDTRDQFDIPDDLANQMLDITHKFAMSIKGHVRKYDIELGSDIVITSVNNLIDRTQQYDFTHAVVIASGCVIHNPDDFCQGIRNQIKNNPGMCMSAHILHTGLWPSENNPDFYTLHEQTILLSRHALDHMADDGLVINEGPGYQTDNWNPIKRDERNVHDDYTPVDIGPDRDRKAVPLTKNSRMGVCEELLNYCIVRRWHVQNFNPLVRRSKGYSYHNERTDEFARYLNMEPRVLDQDVMLRGHWEFFKKFDYRDKFWAFNTESMCDALPDREYDAFIGVAAGQIPWHYLSHYRFAPDTEVIFIDIDPNALKFQRWFVENYDPESMHEWSDIVDRYLAVTPGVNPIGNKDLSSELWLEYRNQIKEKWPQIRNYTYHYVHEDMITSQSLRDWASRSKIPMVWFSNVFRYSGVIEKNYDTESLQNFLNGIVHANRHAAWVGDNMHVGLCVGPNSQPTSRERFCKKLDIPKMDVLQVQKEIQHLENQGMFTDHRGGDHPGWSSFVLHGLGYDKTLGKEYYGYEHDRDAPYDWTVEAEKYTPTLVQYFREAGFKRRYHRIRIMRLAPGGYISIHDDDPQKHRTQWAMNIAINNPEQCEMHFWDQEFRYAGCVPWQPGDAYRIRIHFPHMVMNNSDEVRYHIIVHGED